MSQGVILALKGLESSLNGCRADMHLRENMLFQSVAGGNTGDFSF